MSSRSWTRRRIVGAGLSAVALAPLLWLPREARAGSKKVAKIERGRRGTTVWMHLDAAPFPFGKSAHTDPTVAVYVPHHFRVQKSYGKVDAVLHFHGHRTTVADELRKHQLRQQLVESKQNAILIAPQGPVRSNDSSGGKLEKPRGMLNLLAEVRKTLQLREVTAALGKASLPGGTHVGKVCISAHSGGYKVAARCIRDNAFGVNEVYLFDALYGDVGRYFDWIDERRKQNSADERHKLISYYHKGRTKERNAELMARLDETKIPYVHEEREGVITRAEMTKARVVFIKTSVDHTRLTFKFNTLRDCLFASCLTRRLDTDWFDDKDEKRRLDKRG
jgi:hypothetical protein